MVKPNHARLFAYLHQQIETWLGLSRLIVMTGENFVREYIALAGVTDELAISGLYHTHLLLCNKIKWYNCAHWVLQDRLR